MALAMAAPAFAQQAAGGGASTANDGSLPDIIVTAEKVSENLQTLSTAVVTFSGEDALRSGLPNVDQLLTGTSGIQTQPGPRGTNFTIRGFDGGGVVATSSDVSATGGVAVILDGVYQPRTELFRAGLLDVAQVEVLKGPQSTTIGGSSLIGAVNIVTRQPEFELGGTASLGIGNYNNRTATGVANVPLSETLAVRIAAQFLNRDGYVSSNAANLKSDTERLKLRWRPSDDFDLVLTAERSFNGGNGEYTGNLLYSGYWQPATATNVRPNGPTNQPATGVLGCANPNSSINPVTGFSNFSYATLGCPPAYVYIGSATDPTYRQRSDPWDDGLPKDAWPNNPRSDVTTQTYSARLDANLGFANLLVIPSYQHVRIDQEQAIQAARVPLLHQKQDTTQVDARLASQGESAFKWVFGGYYYYTNAPEVSGNEFFPSYNLFNNPGNPCPAPAAGVARNCYAWQSSKKISQETKSVYGNAQLTVLEGLRVLGGLRYQHDKKDLVSSGATGINGGSRDGPTGITFTYPLVVQGKWEEVNYRAGLEYDVLPSAMVYATYGTGYQPGIIPNIGNPAPTLKQTVKQATFGIKSDWFDKRLRVNIEAFSSRYANYVLANNTFSYGYNVANPAASSTGCTVVGRGVAASLSGGILCAADSPAADLLKSRGVDFDVTWNVTKNDRIDISAELLDTKVSGTHPGTLTVASIQAAVPAATAAQVLATYNGVIAAEQNGVDGQKLQNSPRWTINVSYQHRFELPGGSSLTPRVNWLHKTEYYSSGYGLGAGFTNNGPAVQPTYDLFNFYLTWASADSHYTISAYARNISNYPVLLNYNAGPKPYSAVTLGEPRTYGVTATARF